MAFRITKEKRAWHERISQVWETSSSEARYRFYNFSGDRLTERQLLKLLTDSPASWNNFKKSQKHSIVWYKNGSDLFWLPGYTIDLRDLDLSKADLSDRDLSNID